MTDAELLAALVKAEDPYLRVLGLLAALQRERGQRYNVNGIKLEDYFPMGRISYMQMLHVKILRARAGVPFDDGSYLDSIMDLANYAIFAIMKEKQ